ncbi:hypothetical protein Ciccas_005697 [Cichlidogyrus casuarinus]|uniref:Tyramine beta hydroxylase n=1 Tax=Cichlidogyrus casuarinus TaxID=1844966 RepID=A0ABD2Q7X2_9PLAT
MQLRDFSSSTNFKLKKENRKNSTNSIVDQLRTLLEPVRKRAPMCIEFTRPAESCEYPFGYSITRGTTRIYAFVLDQFRYGSYQLKEQVYATNRVQLLKYEGEIAPTAEELRKRDDVLVFEMTVDNVMIPNVETTYWCKRATLPPLSKKMHIIRYEPVIPKGSVGLVHHMEVFRCKLDSSGQLPPQYNNPCNSETKPMGLTKCREVIGAWAMGATGLDLPSKAGIALNEGEENSYVVIEIHYNNPGLKQGVIDSSGIRFYATENLREHDAAVMELGLNYSPGNSIPPGQAYFANTGYCDGSCTKMAVPKEGITVFASQLHTHTTGIQVSTYHVDSHGVKLANLNEDTEYSPHFQEIRRIRPVVVKPGDTLITECIHNTEGKTHAYLGGISISDEMCLNYIFYYPKIDLELCKSEVSPEELDRFFMNEMNVPIGIISRREQFAMVDWTDENVMKLRDFYALANIEMSCNSSQGQRIENSKILVAPTQVPLFDTGFSKVYHKLNCLDLQN